MLLRGIFLTAAIFASVPARAFDICKYLKDGVAGCRGVKLSSGGSVPSQGAASRMNPGSLPTVTTPFGVEAIYSPASQTGDPTRYAFSLVKGFKQLGTGVSTDSDDNFFTHSYLLAARNTDLKETFNDIYTENDTFVRNFNLATSVALPVGGLEKLVQPNLGLLLRYNVPMEQVGWGGGINLTSKYFTLGASYLKQPNEYELRDIPMFVGTVGVGYGPLRVDFASMNFLEGLLVGNPLAIWTVSLNWRRVIVFGGYRRARNIDGVELTDYLGGFQLLVSKHLALGAMINYIPEHYSVGAQIFL